MSPISANATKYSTRRTSSVTQRMSQIKKGIKERMEWLNQEAQSFQGRRTRGPAPSLNTKLTEKAYTRRITCEMASSLLKLWWWGCEPLLVGTVVHPERWPGPPLPSHPWPPAGTSSDPSRAASQLSLREQTHRLSFIHVINWPNHRVWARLAFGTRSFFLTRSSATDGFFPVKRMALGATSTLRLF